MTSAINEPLTLTFIEVDGTSQKNPGSIEAVRFTGDDDDDVTDIVPLSVSHSFTTTTNSDSNDGGSVIEESPSTFNFNASAEEFFPTGLFNKGTGVIYQQATEASLQFQQSSSSSAKYHNKKRQVVGGERKNRRIKSIAVPVHDPQEIRTKMLNFISYGALQVDRFDSPVHPAIIRAQVYRVRKMVDELVATYKPDLTQPITPTMTRDPDTAERPKSDRRSKKTITNRRDRSKKKTTAKLEEDEDSDPFHLEQLKVSMGIGKKTVNGLQGRSPALQGVPGEAKVEIVNDDEGRISPWSRDLRAATNDVNPIILKYSRKLKSYFNKIARTNMEKITFDRMIPTIREFLQEDGDTINQNTVFHLVSSIMMGTISHDPTKAVLLSKTTLALILFTTKLPQQFQPSTGHNHGSDEDEDEPDDQQTLRNIVIKNLKEAIEDALNCLTSESVKNDSLEMSNFKKDRLRSFFDYAWGLSARGILPSKILRRRLTIMSRNLSDDIIEIEKAVIHLLSAKPAIALMGGVAKRKCEQAWDEVARLVRAKLANSATWSITNRGEAGRFTVLLEISEAETQLAADQGDHRSSYPIRHRETQIYLTKL